jgi:hypothetical protein
MIADFHHIPQLPELLARIVAEAGYSGARMYHTRTMTALAVLNELIRQAGKDAGIISKTGFKNLSKKQREALRCLSFRCSVMGLSAYIRRAWPEANRTEETVRVCLKWFQDLGLFEMAEEAATVQYGSSKETGKLERQIRSPDKLFVGFDLEKALKAYERLHQVLRDQIERSHFMQGKKIIDLPNHCGVSVHHLFEFLFDIPFKMFAPTGEPGFFESAIVVCKRRYQQATESIQNSISNINQLLKTGKNRANILIIQEQQNIQYQEKRIAGITKHLGILSPLLEAFDNSCNQS